MKTDGAGSDSFLSGQLDFFIKRRQPHCVI